MSAPVRIGVGITGHRLDQLPEADRPRLARAVARTLDRIAASAKTTAGAPRMTLVSSLAEGADRYAAEAALARGWRLVAPLPFRTARYLRDFVSPESRAAFRALAAQAAVVEPERRGSYLAAAELLVPRSDVIVALWAGAPPRGPGGAADVAARGLAAGRAVIWLPVAPRQPVRLILPPHAPRRGSRRAMLQAALVEAFRTAPQPEAMRFAA